MNYLRGAVNAISAPYQYYKDINPSTLTGAIDVIVIQRPSTSGDGSTELACSPFHVRFGKWQLLRPSDKKVNVFVNGVKIPFDMKVGEAGEAFFVFETDEDVPEDLITSPVLHATMDVQQKEEGAEGGGTSEEAPQVDSDRFGAKRTDEEKEDMAAKGAEPDFLDLNEGQGSEHAADASSSANASPEMDFRTTPKQTYFVPRALRRQDSKATISLSNSQFHSLNGNGLPSPPPSRDRSSERKKADTQKVEDRPQLSEQDRRVDAALQALGREAHVPEVEYHHDVTLDMEGYKQGYHEDHSRRNYSPNQKSNHDREASDQTIRSSSTLSNRDDGLVEFPRSSPSPRPHLNPHVQSEISSPYESSPPSSASPSSSSSSSSSRAGSPSSRAQPPHPFRATSEPPPDTEEIGISVEHPSPHRHSATLPIPHAHADYPSSHSRTHPHRPHPQHTHSLSLNTSQAPIPHAHGPVAQEYSWEWGAFPQPSPLKATFGKGGRPEPPKGLGLGRGLLTLKERRKEQRKAVNFDEDKEEGASETNQEPLVGATYGRSQSVPPALEGSPTMDKGRRQFREYEDYDDGVGEDSFARDEERGRTTRNRRRILPLGKTPTQETAKYIFEQEDAAESHRHLDSVDFGHGGTLKTSPSDHSLFILQLEQISSLSSICFQLSLVPDADIPLVSTSQLAEWFDRYKVDFERFIADESIVQDPRLVVRWGGQDSEQYVRRSDGSVVFSALGGWREGTIRKPLVAEGDEYQNAVDQPEQSRRDSPAHIRSSGFDERPKPTKKPTSSSWVQWWRSGGNDDTRKPQDSQPAPTTSNSTALEPTQSSASLPAQSSGRPKLEEVKKSHSVDELPQPATKPTHIPMPTPSKRYAKTLRLTSDQLKSLHLKSGSNSITFSLSASGAVAATARIFVWDSTDLVVISDIDGTITKSDGLGHVFAMIGRDWTHSGVAKLYTDIVRNGYKVMYLTSRAIGQADATRDYLKGVKQADYRLPEGPVIMSPDRLMASLHREVIMRKPEVFKMACLRDIQRLFGESARNPFYAGFGNRITDALSYRSVNVPSMRIFTIDSSGEVKMELLELAGYKSSYIHMTDLVDQMFPPIHRKWAPEFTDFNFWKAPVQDFPLPDLSPPSPTLSAISEASNQSALARLRNFSLTSRNNPNRRSQHLAKQSSLSSVINDVREEIENSGQPTDAGKVNHEESGYRGSHLRQMSSFERISSTIGSMVDTYRRSASPSSSSSFLDSDDDSDEDDNVNSGENRKKRRRRSMTSMPGTLDETHFGLDDEEANFTYEEHDNHQRLVSGEPHDYLDGDDFDENREGYSGEDDDNYEEEDADAALDEDLLAAAEMAKVPFLQ